MTSPSASVEHNPFGNSQQAQKPSTTLQDDLFGLDLTQPPQTSNYFTNNNASSTAKSASDDLLMLSGPNPFIQNIVNQQQYPAQGPSGLFGGLQQQAQQVNLFQQQMPSNGGFNNNQNKLGKKFVKFCMNNFY